MEKIALIAPYFGTLPKEWFQLILESCRRNSSIDWILFTDDLTNYDYPENVKVFYQSWEKFSEYIKLKTSEELSISPSLDTPYKLCDYKPIYGDIFQKYLLDYDFWGYTDITDVIYGNLRNFISEKDLKENDKLNFLGHLTLFRNTDEVNKRYKLPLNNIPNINEALTSPINFAFDEAPNGIHQIYLEYGFPFKRIDNIVADISPLRFSFQLSKFDNNYCQYYEKYSRKIFSYRDGTLKEYKISNKGEVVTQEFGYIHFQKRKILSFVEQKNPSFLITPQGFIKYKPIDRILIKKNTPHKLYLPFFKLKWKSLIIRIQNYKRNK